MLAASLRWRSQPLVKQAIDPGWRMIPLTRIKSRRDKNRFQISVSALLTHFAGVQTIDDPSLSHLPWGTQGLWSVWAGPQGGLRSPRSTCCGVSDTGINLFAFYSHLGIHRHGGGMGTRARRKTKNPRSFTLFLPQTPFDDNDGPPWSYFCRMPRTW